MIRYGVLVVILLFSAAAQAEEDSPRFVKIGATLALSGKLAFIGEAERDGLRLAVDEINSMHESPIKFKLFIEDNQGDAKSALSGVTKLLSLDKVDVVFSAFTHITQAIKATVARKGKTMIYASSLGSIAKSNPRFFRDFFDANESGVALAKAVQAAGHNKIVFITETNDACEECEKGFVAETGNKEIEIVRREAFLPGESDFKSLLLKTSRYKPQAFVFCTWRDTHTVIKQMKELNILSIPSFHFVAPFLPVADSPDLRRIYEENELVSTWYGFPEGTERVEQRKFVDKFVKRFGHAPRPDSVFAYDDMFLLFGALKGCVSGTQVKQDCLANAIAASKHQGIAGELKFSKGGLSNREVPLITAKDGVWVPYELPHSER